MCEAQPVIITAMPMQPDQDAPEIKHYNQQYEERRLFIDDDIDESMIMIIRSIMAFNVEDKDEPIDERKPIILYIMSYGGSLDYMWALIDTIEMSETPVYTVNVGQAASAASLIYLAGKKRFMFKRAKLTIHEGSAQIAGDAVKVVDMSESYKKELKQMKDYILDKTSIQKTVLYKKRNNDWEIDAKFCFENGACERIVETLSEVL